MRWFALLLVGLLASAPALPCSFPMPGLLGAHAPGADQEAVPVNARLVFFFPPFAPEVAAHLARDGDEPRAVPARADGELFVVTFDEGLEADTRYTVSFETPREEGERGELPEPFSFATGSERDEEAPRLDEQPAVEVRHRPTGEFDSCTGATNGSWSVTVTVPPASDDVAVAGVRLLRVDQLTGGRVEVAAAPRGTETLHDVRHEQGTVHYVVEAFDLAGNAVESEPLEVALVPFDCSATELPRTTPLGALALLAISLLTLRPRRATR